MGTYQRLKSYFFWPGIRNEVATFVQHCEICARNKSENCRSPGLLQPLQIPDQAWQSILMDLFKGLPKSWGYDVIYVFVDRFTKFGHFIPTTSHYTAKSIAHLFFENVFKLHGLSQSIAMDRDKAFASIFWQELFGKLGSQSCMSTAYPP